MLIQLLVLFVDSRCLWWMDFHIFRAVLLLGAGALPPVLYLQEVRKAESFNWASWYLFGQHNMDIMDMFVWFDLSLTWLTSDHTYRHSPCD